MVSDSFTAIAFEMSSRAMPPNWANSANDGQLLSLMNLLNASRFVSQSSGQPSQRENGASAPTIRYAVWTSSMYWSQSVSVMSMYIKRVSLSNSTQRM